MRTSRWIIVISAGLVLSSACGGGGDQSSSSTAATGPVPGATAPGVDTTSATATTPASSPAGRPVATTAPESGAEVRIIVDTDLAADDIIALQYLAADQRVRLLAVTVNGTGEVTCPRGAEIARGLLAEMGHPDVPVACGSSEPLSGDRAFPAEWRAWADTAYGLPMPNIEVEPGGPDAVGLLTSTITASPTPVTLLTLGGLTNVAEALIASPDLAQRLEQIVIMGGAIDVPGNVTPEGSSAPLPVEWNLYVDPSADIAVLESGAPITFVSLDATNQVPVTEDFVAQLRANDRTHATTFMNVLLSSYAPPYLWDTLAAIALTDPSLVTSHEMTMTITTTGPEAGRTVEQAGGTTVRVADPPDTQAVLDHLLATLAGLASEDELVVPSTMPTVADVTVGLVDGVCTYDGPTELPVGRIVVTLTPSDDPYIVLAAHLVDGATVEEAIAWSEAHPGEQPPMVDAVVAIGADLTPSPATVELLPGANPIVCATPDNDQTLAAVVTAA
jgi:inosine-uridine nucleoside N-ribohydrolase